MPDYYIRTPEQDESRGPFDISKLLTLAEAGQINPNTLYYDENREEWVPLALNEELHAQVFPEREKLALKVDESKQTKSKAKAQSPSEKAIDVEAMLAAAEGNTAEKRKQIRRKKSFERAANLSCSGLGLMMLLSALVMVLPLVPEIQGALNNGNFAAIFNYVSILVAIFDFIIGLLLFLSVTEVFPLARGRAMLTLGFGVYVGWALNDPLLMQLAAAAGVGAFLATISQRMSTMLLAFVLGIGGNGYLAYLALNGRFDGFFDSIVLNLVTN
ncbi:DUF4339 domain-containing protein [Coraliomargarita sp. SDUM461004]|uniref:DUF4339 domain-containing protein n=1 Tax=Thalassobacterium sedimentorum TaxID=3041258 RepID=A0ABU1AEM2_9BACT|nr:DUF4339 domain-containing protein [Coraliomargarita sp. SDUM461004]MDQ8193094.1 DUF4339 domain-containing protein [Coraliomargarita sp. SDUM461004]